MSVDAHDAEAGHDSSQGPTWVDTASGAFRILGLTGAAPGPQDLVCRRIGMGPGRDLKDAEFQVWLPSDSGARRHPLRHHRSTTETSLSWGRMDAGSRDLALSVLNAIVPPVAGEWPKVDLEGTAYSARAFRLHEPFAQEFLVPMPSAGGVIEAREVMAWVQVEEGIDALRSGDPD